MRTPGFAVGLVLCLPAVAAAAAEPELDLSAIWIETPIGQPVIDRGPAGTWEHYAVDNPYVFCEGGKYYCFYEAQDKPFAEGGKERIGLAISEDGIHWKKWPQNPILAPVPDGGWDHVVTKLPAGVIRQNGAYYLFYSGRDGTTKQIGMAKASSPEGPWTRLGHNPVLEGRADGWDRHLSTYPTSVFEQGGVYCLLYRGMQGFYRQQGPGLAISEDLLHWRRASEAEEHSLIPVSEEIASLAVVRANGRYVAISQPMEPARRCYWLSEDLVHWRKGPEVRFRASVAAETLSNPYVVERRWNVLYEQRDRIYRAVLIRSLQGVSP
jgi:predicted GH43/DUF377 family glycosyl hydrolase